MKEVYFTPEQLMQIFKKIPSDHIIIIDNFISSEICDSIVKEIESKATIDEVKMNSDTNVKCKSIPCDIKHKLESFQFLNNQFVNLAKNLNREYGIDIQLIDIPNYRKIYGNTRIHVDGVSDGLGKTDKRTLSIILSLNDDYEGGEIVFPIQNREIKLKKGQIILFPPYWTHPHYTNDLKNNTFRYTINSWFLQT
jgi:predicted 2-oxoglutarate/Fe(II)-dependent dioxygenase YbiX|tara:strand:- start:45 stop:629 length:585 start_codon:yes stop_codon:yes gene_type:complete